jgi:hypothetical protein
MQGFSASRVRRVRQPAPPRQDSVRWSVAVRFQQRVGNCKTGCGVGPRSQSSARDVCIIAGGTFSIGVLHHVVSHSEQIWHNVFQWLYYLPVVYAAAHFGLGGGLATALLASAGYIPHFVMALRAPKDLANQIAELFVLAIVSAVTGILADREHRRWAELEKTTSGNSLRASLTRSGIR